MLIHDSTVHRTIDGTGRVFLLTWFGMQNLNCRRWFDGRLTGEKAPSLRLLDTIEGRMHTVVEIKKICRQAQATTKAVGLIRDLGLTARTSITSFLLAALARAKKDGAAH